MEIVQPITINVEIDETKLRQSVEKATSSICEHDYEELHCDVTTLYADEKACGSHLKALFYCRKCLDIQRREFDLDG